MEESFQDFIINDDRLKTDLNFVHGELTQTYWAKNIPIEIVKKSIAHSLCFNVYLKGHQIAFARIVSDFATYGHIKDVIVTEKHRGKGIGKLIMKFILAHPELQHLRNITLGTLDAQGLYAQFGFVSPKYPERLMELRGKIDYGK